MQLAIEADIAGAVVVYPEIIMGNPLHASRYVRWILYRDVPNAYVDAFKPGELYFCYQEAFDSGFPGLVYGGTLCVTELLLDIYKDLHRAGRGGACYMVRKGKSRTDLPSFRGKVRVDGLDHYALAEAFNKYEYCYFYDLYTHYSIYAAVCGCIPVVVPITGVSSEDWTPGGGQRPGIAYGEEQIPHAIQTRHQLVDELAQTEQAGRDSVRHFVRIVRRHFGGPSP